MELQQQQLAAGLDAISEDIEKAGSYFDAHVYREDDTALTSAEWRLQLAYSKLLVLTEVLKLPLLHAEISATAKSIGTDWTAGERGPDGEIYLQWSAPARRFHRALSSIFLTEPSQTVTKDLEAIIRDSLYTITDARIYGTPPTNEADVHLRIQGIVRCIFPDLLNKPALAKPIKNFEPDTGIPSIETIIEYKFVSDRASVPIVADQILADTRGYVSKHWRSFLYVIYETERFKPETEWRQLLRECGNAENVNAIVLSGASVKKTKAMKGSNLASKKKEALSIRKV